MKQQSTPRSHGQKGKTAGGLGSSRFVSQHVPSINQSKLFRELRECPTSRYLPSYEDLARIEREHHVRRPIKTFVRKCLSYINFLQGSADRDTSTPFRIERFSNSVARHRARFVESFQAFIKWVRRFDQKRPLLWIRALRAPDLTAVKVAISALSPTAYHDFVRRCYGGVT